MSIIGYQTRPIVETRLGFGQTNAAYANIKEDATVYFDLGNITHWDSVYGVSVWVYAWRYGSNVTVDLQHADDPTDGTWATVSGATGTVGTGGTSGSPTSGKAVITAIPASGATLKPYMRIKIVTDAATAAFIVAMNATSRGGSV